MFIHTFPCEPFSTNTYVAVCERTNDAVVVDPGLESFIRVKSLCEGKGYRINKVLLTHSHWDHIVDVHQFYESLKLPIYIHSLDAPNLITPGADGLPTVFPIIGCSHFENLVEGQEISWGDCVVSVIHTPGHSPGGVCFYAQREKILFSGDTLFKGTIGNLSFPTSSPEQMWISLRKLALLPSETKVYPGHGPSTTIGSEHWLKNAKEIFGNE